MANNRTVKMTTELVRFNFCHLFKQRLNDQKEEDGYSCLILIPKKDKKTLSKINKLVDALKKDYWGNKVPPKYKGPLRDGDEYVNEETGEPDPTRFGCYFLNARSMFKPDVIDRYKEKIEDERGFYNGCYGLACINFYAYENKTNKGISCGISSVMKIKDGEPLSGVSSGTADFKDVDASEYDDDEEDDYS